MRRFVGVLLACALLPVSACAWKPDVAEPSAITSTTAVAATTSTTAVAATTTTTPDSVLGGKIAFDSNRDGDYEIYVMNADGTGVTQLTDNDGSDGEAVWSPNGDKIAFVSDRDGGFDLYVMNADGTGVTQLTDDGGGSPAWSPSGDKIVFTRNVDLASLVREIFVMNADGTGVTQLTDDGGGSPAWSPSGDKIAFTRRQETWVVNMDGTGGGGRRWRTYIYVMNADGTGVSQLTDDGGGSLAWSPNGDKIALMHDREIFVKNTDEWGFGAPRGHRVTSRFDSYRDESPVWSPNGHKIAFTRSGGTHQLNRVIFVMNADGSDVVSLGQQGFVSSWVG